MADPPPPLSKSSVSQYSSSLSHVADRDIITRDQHNTALNYSTTVAGSYPMMAAHALENPN